MGTLSLASSGGGTISLAPASSASSATATLPAVTGQVQINNNMPAFSAYPSGSQNVSNNTATKLTFDTVSFDTNSNYSTSTSRFSPTVAGYYQINSGIGSVGLATGNANLAIYKNGTFFIQIGYCASVSTYLVPIGSTLIYMNGTTDYIEMYLTHNAGSTVAFGPGPNYTFFSGCLVRSA